LPITGEAPVPVPPPIPAAMNTMSAPSTISISSSVRSTDALCAASGSDPAPSALPREFGVISCSRTPACEARSA
jgi:hypothetical protein